MSEFHGLIKPNSVKLITPGKIYAEFKRMIIRKPTKIELKVENDLQDYEMYKLNQSEKLRALRQNAARGKGVLGALSPDDGLQMAGLFSNEQLRNRALLFDNHRMFESASNYMTPQGNDNAAVRRNVYYPESGQGSQSNDNDDEDYGLQSNNTRMISALLHNTDRGSGGDTPGRRPGPGDAGYGQYNQYAPRGGQGSAGH